MAYRPKKITWEKRKKFENLLKSGVNIGDCCEVLGLSRHTLVYECKSGRIDPKDKKSYSAEKAQRAEEDRIFEEIERIKKDRVLREKESVLREKKETKENIGDK